MEGLTALFPLIPSMIKAGKSAWTEFVKPLLIGKGLIVTKEMEEEMLKKERAKDIDGFIDKMKEIEQKMNQTSIMQNYSGDGGNQIGINTGTIYNYNITGIGKEINQEKGVKLSENACQLLKEMAADPSGQLLTVRVLSGRIVQTNGKSFGAQKHDRRAEAEIDATIEELEKYDLIRPTGYKRELFEITDNGYKIADKINL
jgi:hypothetical protein